MTNLNMERGEHMLKNIRHRSTTGTRLTPGWVIDLCIAVMGHIDLDPTSEPGPPFNVPAGVHWTKEDDCLSQPRWFGNVFMNPPHGKKRGVQNFLNRLLREFIDGYVEQAMVLLPVDTSTEWWTVLGNIYPWCAFSTRLKFDNMKTGAGFPSAMFYMGGETMRFRKTFVGHGIIYEPFLEWEWTDRS